MSVSKNIYLQASEIENSRIIRLEKCWKQALYLWGTWRSSSFYVVLVLVCVRGRGGGSICVLVIHEPFLYVFYHRYRESWGLVLHGQDQIVPHRIKKQSQITRLRWPRNHCSEIQNPIGGAWAKDKRHVSRCIDTHLHVISITMFFSTQIRRCVHRRIRRIGLRRLHMFIRSEIQTHPWVTLTAKTMLKVTVIFWVLKAVFVDLRPLLGTSLSTRSMEFNSRTNAPPMLVFAQVKITHTAGPVVSFQWQPTMGRWWCRQAWANVVCRLTYCQGWELNGRQWIVGHGPAFSLKVLVMHCWKSLLKTSG